MADYQDQYAQRNAPSRPMDASIDQGLRSYMLGVYNYMGLGVALTGVVSLFVAMNPPLMATIAMGPMKWVLFAGIFGLSWFAPKIIFSSSIGVAHAVFWGYAALWGVLIAPMLFYFQQAGATQVIAQAFFITASVFGAVSLYGYTTKRDLSPMASFFFMATIGLLVAIIVNAIFFQSDLVSLITSALVVLVFSGVTAFYTQTVKEMYFQVTGAEERKRASIIGAFSLYSSFIVLFIHILNILGIMRSE
ncbi:MAG: Bax inhibitor-1/YccA family protein [Pseudomonadota bacterium]